jgi:hypothetical protein
LGTLFLACVEAKHHGSKCVVEQIYLSYCEERFKKGEREKEKKKEEEEEEEEEKKRAYPQDPLALTHILSFHHLPIVHQIMKPSVDLSINEVRALMIQTFP